MQSAKSGFTRFQFTVLLGMFVIVAFILLLNYFLESKIAPAIKEMQSASGDLQALKSRRSLASNKDKSYLQKKNKDGVKSIAPRLTDPRRYGIITVSKNMLEDMQPEEYESMIEEKISNISAKLDIEVKNRIYQIVNDPHRSKQMFKQIDDSLKACEEGLAKNNSDRALRSRKVYLLIRKGLYTAAQENKL